MNDRNIGQLEARLEQLVEGAFTSLFGHRLSLRDIALKLARAMESDLKQSPADPRPIAPDHFTITLHPMMQKQLLQTQPQLAMRLSEHLVEFATDAGYRLVNVPDCRILANDKQRITEVRILAQHSEMKHRSTAAMKAIKLEDHAASYQKPHLIVNGDRVIELNKATINVGRGTDNDIILDDAYISRHHLQIRLRFGVYTVFDVESKGGTRVNNVYIQEHRLQPGDVIRIGDTQLLYVADETAGRYASGTTDSLEPIDF